MPYPAEPPEKLTQENDYTLSVEKRRESTLEASEPPLKTVSSVTRTFNFQSQQVTTTTREYIYQLPKSMGYSAGAVQYNSGSSGVAVASFVQNFEDIQSPAEIARLHKQLVAFGGHPPELDTLQTSPARSLVKGAPGLKGAGG